MDMLELWLVKAERCLLSMPSESPVQFCKCRSFCANFHPDRVFPVSPSVRPPFHDMCPFYFKNRPEVYKFELVDEGYFKGWKAHAVMSDGVQLEFARHWPSDSEITGRAEIILTNPADIAEETLIKHQTWMWPRLESSVQFIFASERPFCFTQGTYEEGEEPSDFHDWDEVWGAEKLQEALIGLFP